MSDKNIKLKNVKTGDYLFPKTKVGNVEGLTPIYLSDGTSASATVNADTLNGKTDSFFQQQLVSGTNIKTIDNISLLGSGNVTSHFYGLDADNLIASYNYAYISPYTYTAVQDCYAVVEEFSHRDSGQLPCVYIDNVLVHVGFHIYGTTSCMLPLKTGQVIKIENSDWNYNSGTLKIYGLK